MREFTSSAMSFLAPLLLLVSLVISLLQCVVRSTMVMVDDTDPRIEYFGSWVRNPISDVHNNSYGGTLTGTNITEAAASFIFGGGE